MGHTLTRMFWAGLCFGAGAVLLLLHVTASAGSAVVFAEWLRIGVGLAGLALLAISHFLRVRVLAGRRHDAGPSTTADPAS